MVPRELIVGEIYQSDLIVSDVHRNEQVNIVALSKGLQTVLCCNLLRNKHYALWPMKGDSFKYALNADGEHFRDQIRNEYGDKVVRFRQRIIYAARVYATCRLSQNTIDFWQEMQDAALFRWWDAEKGPYKWYGETVYPEVQMLRVYRIDRDLNPNIAENIGYRNAPKWIGPPDLTPFLVPSAT